MNFINPLQQLEGKTINGSPAGSLFVVVQVRAKKLF